MEKNLDLVNEEFCRYAKYINYTELSNKTFLITGAKGYLASSMIRFLLYLNNITNHLKQYVNKIYTKVPDKKTLKQYIFIDFRQC